MSDTMEAIARNLDELIRLRVREELRYSAQHPDQRMYGLKEAARFLRIDHGKITRAVRAGIMPTTPKGKRYLLRESDLTDWQARGFPTA